MVRSTGMLASRASSATAPARPASVRYPRLQPPGEDMQVVAGAPDLSIGSLDGRDGARRADLAGGVGCLGEGRSEGVHPTLRPVAKPQDEPSVLGISRLHQPPAGRLEFHHLSPDLRAKPGVRRREARRCGDGVDQARVLDHGRVMDQERHGLAVAIEPCGDLAGARVGRSERSFTVVQVGRAVLGPVADPEAGIAEQPGQLLVQGRRRGLAQLHHDVREGPAVRPDQHDREPRRRRAQDHIEQQWDCLVQEARKTKIARDRDSAHQEREGQGDLRSEPRRARREGPREIR